MWEICSRSTRLFWCIGMAGFLEELFVRRPVVTVHALRRFAERALGVTGLPDDDREAVAALAEVHGLDVKQIREALRGLIAQGVDLGAEAVTLSGFRYVLRDGALITVLDKRNKYRRRGPRIEQREDFP